MLAVPTTTHANAPLSHLKEQLFCLHLLFIFFGSEEQFECWHLLCWGWGACDKTHSLPISCACAVGLAHELRRRPVQATM